MRRPPPFAHRLPRPGPHALALGLIVLLAVGLRAAWIAYLNVDPADGRFDDSFFYRGAAVSLAEGRGYLNPWSGETTAQWPPAYSATLAAAHVLFGTGLIVTKVINVLLAVASVLLIYLLGSRLFDRRVGLIAALLLAAFPSYIYFSTVVAAENLFVPAMLLVLVLVVWWGLAGRRPSPLQSLALGGAIAFAALTRGEALWLMLPVAVVWALASRRWRAAAVDLGLVVLGLALVLTPWTVRNAVELDAFVPVRAGAVSSLAETAHPHYERYSIPAPPRYEYQEYLPPEPPPTMSDTLGEYGRAPWLVFALAGKKIYDLFEDDHGAMSWVAGNGPRPAVGETAFGRWNNVANIAYYGLGIVALAGLGFLLRERDRGGLLLAGVLGTWTLGFIIYLPETRYHLALVPVALVPAAVVFARLRPVVEGGRDDARTLRPSLVRAAAGAGAVVAAITIGTGIGAWTGAPAEAVVHVAGLGEPVRLGDLEVTADGYAIDPPGQPKDAPAGFRWLVVDAVVRNAGAGDVLLIGVAQTSVEDASGNAYFLDLEATPGRHLDGPVGAGEALSGSAAFAVPEGAAGLEFVFRAIGVDEVGRWRLE